MRLLGALLLLLVAPAFALAADYAVNPSNTDAVANGRLRIEQTPGVPGLQVPVLAGTPVAKQNGDHWCQEDDGCCRFRWNDTDFKYCGTPQLPTSTPTRTPTSTPTPPADVGGIEYLPNTSTPTATLTPTP